MVLIEQTENSLEQIQLSIPGDGKIIYECMWSAYPAMLKNAFSTIKAIKLGIALLSMGHVVRLGVLTAVHLSFTECSDQEAYL